MVCVHRTRGLLADALVRARTVGIGARARVGRILRAVVSGARAGDTGTPALAGVLI